jgi:hypothetical protein
MKEEFVWIPVEVEGKTLKLEGRFAPGEVYSHGVVICHPHPLYGGDMDNGVVVTLQKAFYDGGFTTMRFNFRGVGASSGSYGGGQGEVEDLIAVCEFMKARGIKHIYGAGYSFGSWILLKSLPRESFNGLVLVAPPVNLLDFEDLKIPGSIPSLILVGSRDEFCSQDQLQTWLQKTTQSDSDHFPVSVSIIEGENHFFWNSLSKVFNCVREEAKKWLIKDAQF